MSLCVTARHEDVWGSAGTAPPTLNLTSVEVNGQLHSLTASHVVLPSVRKLGGFFMRHMNWIDASKSSVFLTVFFFNLLKFPGHIFSPSPPEPCSEMCHCGIWTTLSLRQKSLANIDSYRPALTGFLPLDVASAASLFLATVDTVFVIICISFYFSDFALYSSPNIIGVIESIRVRWAEHVACMGERCIQGFSGET